MEAERKKERQKRQVSKKNTSFNIKERKRKAAAEAREKNSALMALYNMFFPDYRGSGTPKYITDKYGNRVRSGMGDK